ncbi:hypothetical protein [Paraburkholderia sp.]|uniref:lysozyme inhibitor LprI family protein n=1 Tax=Paraburkholderia sp. TaxID=1926495 RepID=UPI00239BCA11|nr:hypothetical protein [Paraburkholderia sp.]MDE1179971.1 hypothetical protein [Paraburkholderia sp.]
MSILKMASARVARLILKPSTLVSIGLLAAGTVASVDAAAASFQCSKHSSASEKIVCNDAQLSALDDRLAASYQRAKEESTDPVALEAARTHQWLWRQHNCTDKACVTDWYQRRIAELNADFHQATQSRHDAFEASLKDQHLEPSAADAVRRMKDASVASTKPVTTAQ